MSDTEPDDEDEVLDDEDYVRLCKGWKVLARLRSLHRLERPGQELPSDLVKFADWPLLWEADERVFKDRALLRSMINTFDNMLGDTPCSAAYVILTPTKDQATLTPLPYGPYDRSAPWPRLLFFNPNIENARDAALGIMGWFEEGDSPVFSPYEDDHYYDEEQEQLGIEWKEDYVASRLGRLIEHDGDPIEALLDTLPHCEAAVDELLEEMQQSY